jgi:hypothetical protein
MHLGSHVDVQTLCMSVFEALDSGKSAEALQGDLCDLVGFDRMDFVSELLAHRATIVDAVHARLPTHPLLAHTVAASAAPVGKSDGPHIAGRVVVTSTKEILEEKAQRKARRKEAARCVCTVFRG